MSGLLSSPQRSRTSAGPEAEKRSRHRTYWDFLHTLNVSEERQREVQHRLRVAMYCPHCHYQLIGTGQRAYLVMTGDEEEGYGFVCAEHLNGQPVVADEDETTALRKLLKMRSREETSSVASAPPPVSPKPAVARKQKEKLVRAPEHLRRHVKSVGR